MSDQAEIIRYRLTEYIKKILRGYGRKPTSVRCILGYPDRRNTKDPFMMTWAEFAEFGDRLEVIYRNDCGQIDISWSDKVPEAVRELIRTLRFIGIGWWLEQPPMFSSRPEWTYHTHPLIPKQAGDLGNYIAWLWQSTRPAQEEPYDPTTDYVSNSSSLHQYEAR